MAILSEALRKQEANFLSTGEPFLDDALASIHYDHNNNNNNNNSENASDTIRGVPIRSFTEISAPPGCGKTAIWLGLAVETLKKGIKVLYVSCNFTAFPLGRAKRLAQWNPSRYESRIHQIYVSSMDQYLLLENVVDLSSYGLLVLDHYDALIKLSWDRETAGRASEALLHRATEFAKHTCVVATASSVKYQNEENCVLFAPSTVNAKTKSSSVKRVSLYRDFDGNSALSTGVKFRISQDGLKTVDGSTSTPSVPLYVLSSKKRLTPDRREALHVTTPTSSERKRRLSQITPVKAGKFLKTPRSVAGVASNPALLAGSASRSADTVTAACAPFVTRALAESHEGLSTRENTQYEQPQCHEE